MVDVASPPTVRTPWHLWVVGVFAILWNSFGCLDFTMTMIRPEAWLAQWNLTQSQLAYFEAMPGWTFVAWGVGVWGGAIGGLLLLLRRRLAFPVFAISFLGWLAGAIYAFVLSDGMEAMGSMWPMQALIGAMCLAFIGYAQWMAKRGVLR